MRAPAPGTRRATRTRRHSAVVVPDAAPPGVAPGSELAGATWATQDTTSELLVDLERVCTYDQQWVPPSTKRRLSHPAKDFGRAVALPGRHHALVADEEGQPERVALNASSPAMTPTHLHVVTHGVAQHPPACLDARPPWRTRLRAEDQHAGLLLHAVPRGCCQLPDRRRWAPLPNDPPRQHRDRPSWRPAPGCWSVQRIRDGRSAGCEPLTKP